MSHYDRYGKKRMDGVERFFLFFFIFAGLTAAFAISAAILESTGLMVDASKVATITSDAAKRHDLSLIRPFTGQQSCPAGQHWIGYQNGTIRPVGKMHFEVRGYVANRVDNVIPLKARWDKKMQPIPGEFEPNVSIDRIVQPQETFGECVKLHSEELTGVSYKVKPAEIEYLDSFSDYAQYNQLPGPKILGCDGPKSDGKYSCELSSPVKP